MNDVGILVKAGIHNELIAQSELEQILIKVHDSLEKVQSPARRGSKSIGSGVSAGTLKTEISISNITDLGD